jgi:hypothetical protein
MISLKISYDSVVLLNSQMSMEVDPEMAGYHQCQHRALYAYSIDMLQ